MTIRKSWALAAIIWMASIFCFTQFPYFTGENTSQVIHKVVEKEHITIHTPSADKDKVGTLNLIVRKATHITVFGILAFLLYKTLEANRYASILSWFLTVLYAVSDEYHQSFMPGRVSTYKDVLFDSFGALLTLILIFLLNKQRKVSG